MSHQCQNCPRRTVASEIGARAAGWIVWSGTTIGGEQVDRTYCPACAGRTPSEADLPSWDAECETCGARMSDEYWDADEEDRPYSEEDARDWKSDHQCEPDVRLISPEQIDEEKQRHAKHLAMAAAT